MTLAPVVPLAHYVPPGERYDGVAIASTGKRVAAFAIDAAIAWLILFSSVMIASATQDAIGGPLPTILYLVIVLGSIITAICLLAFRGWSIGKLLLGLRVVNVDTNKRIGVGRALLRTLVLVVMAPSIFGFVLILLSVFVFDDSKRGRGWHDLAGKDIEIDVRVGVNPFVVAGTAPAQRVVRYPAVGAVGPVAQPIPGMPAAFESDADGVVEYVAVERDGALFGFLWSSDEEDAAGFVPVTSAGNGARFAASDWSAALAGASQRGLRPSEAVLEARTLSRGSAMGTVAPQSLGPISLAALRNQAAAS